MTIAFSCPTCSKSYKVADNLAGKKAKCAGCGNVITIPQDGAFTPAPPSPPPPQDDFAFHSNEPETTEWTPGHQDDDYGGSPARTYQRKRQPSKKPLILAGAGVLALILLGGMVWAVYMFAFRAPYGLGSDLDYMPDNCQYLVRIQLAELVESAAFKEIKAEFPEIDQGLKEIQTKSTDLGPNDISQVLVGGNADDNGQNVVVTIRAKKLFTIMDVVNSPEGGKATEEKVGSYTMYIKQGFALCQPEKTLAIFGPPAAVRKVLQRNKRPDLPGGLKKILDEIDTSASVYVAVDVESLAKSNLGNVVPGEAKDQVKDILGVGAEIDFEDQISINVVGLCKDAKSAEDNANKAKAFIEMGKMFIADKLPTDVAQILNTVKVANNGDKITANVAFKPGPLIKAVKGMKGGLPFGE